MTDKEIMELYRSGSQEKAFALLVDSYTERLYWHIRRFACSHDDANDLLQDIFIKIWTSLPSFREESQLFTWLYRIARNTAFDHLNKHDREKTNMPTTSINEDIAELKELPATMHNPEEDIINQQEYDKWLTNIEKLKDDYKVVAKMNLIDNFGYKEIADALDMPINTVKTKIRRAKAQLLKMMDYSDELL